jgi:hypothetical protein
MRATRTLYTRWLLYLLTTDHHRPNLIKLVSIPFHQQKPKQIAHVDERITPRPIRFEFFHDQGS